ncbi:MAG: ABC transporter permease, partial [Candidatus Aminicenantes bacterium]|nr:ABC transporter permease [Candidatus Aminicenantes bacterium]
SYQSRKFYETMMAIDPQFFEMFHFAFLKGQPETALPNAASIVLSEEMALKFFGTQEPVGEILTIDGTMEFIVTGVFRNMPSNSSIQFDIAVPVDHLVNTSFLGDNWLSNVGTTFVRIEASSDAAAVEQNISDLIQKHYTPEEVKNASVPSLGLEPLKNMHFSIYSGAAGRRIYITIYLLIGILTLSIACINYINLATARSMRRSKEIGMRKIIGASRTMLVAQIMAESIMTALLSLVLAFGLAALFLPFMNRLIGADLQLNPLHYPLLLMGALGITVLAGCVSGVYPALQLTNVKAADVIKNRGQGRKKHLLRRTLVVGQFVVTTILIVFALVIVRQKNHIQVLDSGYDKDNIIQLQLRDNGTLYEALKLELKTHSLIEAVGGSGQRLPYNLTSSTVIVDWDGKNPESSPLVLYFFTDYDFIPALGLEVAEGRNYSPDFSDEGHYIINEAMVRQMELEHAVGAELTFWGSPGTIIGVVKDFFYRSMDERILPLVILLRPDRVRNMLIRFRPQNQSSVLSFARSAWEKVIPSAPFEYEFLGDIKDSAVVGMDRMAGLIGVFAGLAILIACLGLFGLTICAMEQRTKEIGIRKVVGASVPGLLVLLLKEYFWLILLANAVAWPLAYSIMKGWLRGFPYRTSLPAGLFLEALLLTFVLCLLTVAFRSLKAAYTDPVKSLRYE